MKKISAVFLLVLSLAVLMSVAANADTPVEISSAAELMSMKMDGSYKLVEDIDLTGVEFTPIGTDTAPFTGVFDGNSKRIYGLTFETQGEYIGLFGVCKDATIKNVVVDNLLVDISGYTSDQMYISGICAYAFGNCSFENITVKGSISVKGSGDGDIYTAGICAYVESVGGKKIFTSCVNKARIKAESTGIGATVRSSGIVASGEGAYITLCANKGSISVKAKSAAYAAGISAEFGQKSLERTYNTANITAKSEYSDAFAGGLISTTVYSKLIDCYNAGNVYADGGSTSKSGGICAESLMMNEYSNCYNAGEVTVVKGGHAGSLVATANANSDKFVSNYVIESDTPIISKNPKEGAATSLTQTEMKSDDSFKSFDFDKVWYMAEDGDYLYPMLCGFEIEKAPDLVDLDEDGSVDDVELIIGFLAEFDGYDDYISVEKIDDNSDGKITALDLVRFARRLAGWEGY